MRPQKAIVVPDAHLRWDKDKSQHYDRKYWRALLRYMADDQWDYYINLGDFLDMEGLSRFSASKAERLNACDLEGDYEIGNQVLDLVQQSVGKECSLVQLQGNHEHRVQRFAEEAPQFGRLLNIPHQLGFKVRGVRWVECYTRDELFKLGHLYFHHGRYISKHHAYKHVDHYGVSLMYGHTHCIQSHTKVLKGKDRSLIGQSMGCACLYEQHYMGGRPNNWQQAFGVVWSWPNGNFNYQVVRVLGGEFVAPNGKHYTWK